MARESRRMSSSKSDDIPELTDGCDCYCDLWTTNPEHLQEQGLPPGFCGFCDVCGEPGHTIAHSNRPTTGAWCEEHQPSNSKVYSIPTLPIILAMIALGIYFLQSH